MMRLRPSREFLSSGNGYSRAMPKNPMSMAMIWMTGAFTITVTNGSDAAEGLGSQV